MTQTYIVTGGGFIGSHIVERLPLEEHQVRIIDDFSTGRRSNLEHFANNDNLSIHEVSITNLEAMRSIFEGVEVVFHQAALPSVPRSIEAPLDTQR